MASLKLLRPLLIHLDGGGVVLRVLRAEPEIVRVLEEGGEVVGVGGVHHVEEELAVGQVRLGALLGEELGQLLLLHDVGDEADDAELVILGHLDGAELGRGDEVLPAGEHLLQEVLGHLLPGRHVELAYLVLE